MKLFVQAFVCLSALTEGGPRTAPSQPSFWGRSKQQFRSPGPNPLHSPAPNLSNQQLFILPLPTVSPFPNCQLQAIVSSCPHGISFPARLWISGWSSAVSKLTSFASFQGLCEKPAHCAPQTPIPLRLRSPYTALNTSVLTHGHTPSAASPFTLFPTVDSSNKPGSSLRQGHGTA